MLALPPAIAGKTVWTGMDTTSSLGLLLPIVMVLETVLPWNCEVLAMLRIVPSAESKDHESGLPGCMFMAFFMLFPPIIPLY